MLIPAEGDTGSPVEGLLGRGRSSTSPVIVVLVGLATILAGSSFLFDGSRHILLLVALIVGVVLLLNRGIGNRSQPVPPPVPPSDEYPSPIAESVDPSAYRPP